MKDTLIELFGKDSAIPSVHFGSYLKHLCDNLGGDYCPEKLLQENTLFPLYRPFLPKQRADELSKQMTIFDGNGVVTKIGMAAGSICEKSYFQYCPGCIDDDRRTYNDVYIHRIHQAQGVLLCPKHGCLLHQAIPPAETSRLKYLYLENLIPDMCISVLPDQRQSDILRKIAASMEYLLSHDLSFSDKETVTLRYKRLLQRRKMITNTGRVKQNDYLYQLQAFYGKELLELLDSVIDEEDEYTWAKVIVRNAKRTVHPLRHILLINFLTDMDTFFEGILSGDLFTLRSVRKNHPKNDDRLEEYKRIIQKTICENPLLSRTELRKHIDREYSYIYRRDQIWLMENLPAGQRCKIHSGHIDWEQRDVEYCQKLRKAYQACLTDGGRISTTRLIRRADIQANMENKRSKLKHAWKYLENVSQTVEDYQVERCLKTIRTYVGNHEQLPKWKLLRIAGLTEKHFQIIEDRLMQKLIRERMVDAVAWEAG